MTTHPQPDRTFLYQINAQEFASSNATQTAQQLKAQAGVDLNFVLFRVDGDTAGERLEDTDTVTFSGHQVENFYAIRPEDAKERPHFKFNVDGERYESVRPDVTGEDIKTMAKVGAAALLFLEGHREADRQIADHERVNLSLPGTENFYTSLPAQNGEQR